MDATKLQANPLTKQIGAITDVVVDLNHTLDVAMVNGADYIGLQNLNITIQTLMNYRDRLVSIQAGGFASQL